MRKQTNTLSPSPKGFQSPKFSDSDFREVRDSDMDVQKALLYCHAQGDIVGRVHKQIQKILWTPEINALLGLPRL
jgi:hypothetical protein